MTSAWGDLSFVILSHDSGTKRYLGVILHVHFYTPRWNLEGFCQAVTLKMAKCSPLTRSQPCLSPSHSKHSPTPLTPSQSERPSLNTRVDEAWLIEARKSWTAAQPLQVVLFFWESLSDENEKNKKQVWFPPSAFTHPSAWSWAKRQPTCCEDRLFIKISQKALFGSRGSSYYTAAGERDVSMTVVVLSLPVLGSIWYRLCIFFQQVQFFHLGLSWVKHSGGYRASPLSSLRLADRLFFWLFFLLLLNLTKRQIHSYQHCPEWSFWKTS